MATGSRSWRWQDTDGCRRARTKGVSESPSLDPEGAVWPWLPCYSMGCKSSNPQKCGVFLFSQQTCRCDLWNEAHHVILVGLPQNKPTAKAGLRLTVAAIWSLPFVLFSLVFLSRGAGTILLCVNHIPSFFCLGPRCSSTKKRTPSSCRFSIRCDMVCAPASITAHLPPLPTR